jgi:hypothetical protein
MLLCPGTENGPVTLTDEICTESVVSFLSVTVALDVWPTVTVPKESALADATRLPVVVTAELPAIDPHPDRITAAQHDAIVTRAAHQIVDFRRPADE